MAVHSVSAADLRGRVSVEVIANNCRRNVELDPKRTRSKLKNSGEAALLARWACASRCRTDVSVRLTAVIGAAGTCISLRGSHGYVALQWATI